MEKEDGSRKRSKRHRRKRNNISDKDRVQSTIEFGVISRGWEAKRKARWAPPVVEVPVRTSTYKPRSYAR